MAETFVRKFIEIVELDLDRCLNTYGSTAGGSTCTAAGAAGSECYNTYGTCQDKTHYRKGTKTYRFCSRGAPLTATEAHRPYIDKITSAATEIKPEDGLAQRSTSSVTMLDEPDSDIEQDPYVRNRASAAQGTFWTRLLARNYNYAGRFARIKRGYLTADAWNEEEFSTELYMLDAIKGPTNRGQITLTLKDPIKIADRIKVPIPTSGKLGVVFGTNDLQLTLDSNTDMSQYPDSGYIRHKGQVIQYTAKAGYVLSWPSSTYRSQFNTTAEAGAIGDAVQLCRAWVSAPLTTVYQDILNDAGIEDTYVDLAGFAVEEANWYGSRYYVTACITDPEDASNLLKELLQQSNSAMWWSPSEQKAKLRVIGPRPPTETSNNTLTDEANLIEDTVTVTPLDSLRLTFAVVNYALTNATANSKEAKNYLRAAITVDTDAESENEYNDQRQKVHYSRWFGAANDDAMRALASRMIGYYRDAPKQIDLSLDPKDAAIREGDLYDLSSKQLVDKTGAPRTERVLVTKRQDDGKGRIKVTVRTTTFSKRYAFIAPNGHPDYTGATAAQRQYAFISTNPGLMSDGSSAYLVI